MKPIQTICGICLDKIKFIHMQSLARRVNVLLLILLDFELLVLLVLQFLDMDRHRIVKLSLSVTEIEV